MLTSTIKEQNVKKILDYAFKKSYRWVKSILGGIKCIMPMPTALQIKSDLLEQANLHFILSICFSTVLGDIFKNLAICLQVFPRKRKNKHSFSTFENNTRATVARGTSNQGRHYITTHPDGITENNLDELNNC